MRKLIIPVLAFVSVACSGGRQSAAPAAASQPTAAPAVAPGSGRVIGGAPADLPKAVVYRTDGDYSGYVPVTVGQDGSLISYPAPTDVSATASAPLPVAGGLWLDRRGISINSVFTRYTYAEYAALPETPAPEQLLEAVIPGARVTTVYTLPMTAAEAAADTAAVNAYIIQHPQQFR